MAMISNFLFNFINLDVIVSFLDKIANIWYSTVVNVEVVAKPLVFGISVLTSVIFALRIVLVAKLVKLGILSSIVFIFALF